MKFEKLLSSPLARLHKRLSSPKKNKEAAPLRTTHGSLLSTEDPQLNVLSTEGPQQNVLSTEGPQQNVLSTEGPQQNADTTIVGKAGIRADTDDELLAVFEHLDGDGDGKVSAEELRKSVGTLSEEEAEEAVRLWDTNGDGMLDFGEFQKLLEGGVREGSTEEKRRELREAFEMYVADGSECITPGSLRKMLSRLGECRSIEDCEAMIRAFDLDGDGTLGFDEFVVMMR